jgi:hypothetical protein
VNRDIQVGLLAALAAMLPGAIFTFAGLSASASITVSVGCGVGIMVAVGPSLVSPDNYQNRESFHPPS